MGMLGHYIIAHMRVPETVILCFFATCNQHCTELETRKRNMS